MIRRLFNRRLRVLVQPTQKMDASSYTSLNHPNVDLEAKTIREGKAVIRLSTEKVFYNPVQEFNRDLSIAVLTVFSSDHLEEKVRIAQERVERREKEGLPAEEIDNSKNLLTILEPLSATGLRSIRYAKEVPNVSKVVANDISWAAVEVIKDNIIVNNISDLIEANQDDACMVMYKHKGKNDRFTAIDLDPYGCPSIFLDAAVQAVEDGGLLLVTATDMAVLAGNSPETCYVKYGAVSLKTKACHEMALRILLQCIEAHANRYGRYITPLLSVSVDFYIRVFVKVNSGLAKCKLTTTKLSMVHHCTGCGSLVLQPLGGIKPNPSEKNPNQMKNYLPTGPPVSSNCAHCNSTHHLGGPIWSGPLHDFSFVERVLSHVCNHPTDFGTAKRLEGVLSVVKEEIEAPLYYTTDNLFGTTRLEVMKMIVLRSAILNAGYKVSYSHACKNSIKTNAPAQLVWDIVRTWEKSHPAKPSTIEKNPVATHILSQTISNVIDFTVVPEANPLSRRDGCLRFQFNPTPFWGPGSKSNINVGSVTYEKSVNKQKSKKQSRKRQGSPHIEESKKSNDMSDENKNE